MRYYLITLAVCVSVICLTLKYADQIDGFQVKAVSK